MADVLIVLAPERFRDEEVIGTGELLAAHGHAVSLASTRRGRAVGVLGTPVEVEHRLADIHGADWDAVVFAGGAGAEVLWSDAHAIRVAREADAAGRIVAAICVAPVILAHAGLLRRRHATVWHGERARIAVAGALASPLHVVVDGNLITADGPAQVQRFATAIAAALAGERVGATPGAAVPEMWTG